jgi:hypothetical protein
MGHLLRGSGHRWRYVVTVPMVLFLDLDQASGLTAAFAIIMGEVPMSDPTNVIMQAIRSAFEGYPKEGDPDWRSPSWIMPEECAHLTKVIIRELEARGFQIVKKPSDA